MSKRSICSMRRCSRNGVSMKSSEICAIPRPCIFIPSPMVPASTPSPGTPTFPRSCAIPRPIATARERRSRTERAEGHGAPSIHNLDAPDTPNCALRRCRASAAKCSIASRRRYGQIVRD